MNFSYAVVAGASVVAGTSLVSVGTSFGDNVQGSAEAEALRQANALSETAAVGSNSQGAAQGANDGCYGEYVVQLIA